MNTTNKQVGSLRNKRLIGILLAVGLLLLVPLIAMQFTNGVDWDGSDFFIAAVLLLGTGFTIDLVLRKVKGRNIKIAVIAVVLIALFLIWAELAVGIFGSPFAGS